MTAQFNRFLRLTVLGPGYREDLSEFRVKFVVSASDFETPNTAIIRVYNLKDETVRSITATATAVILDAGYESNNGTVFVGDVKQFKFGKEGNVDRYLEFYAADGDILYTTSTVRTNLPRTGAFLSADQVQDGILRASGGSADDTSRFGVSPFPGGVALKRGKVLWGMTRDYLRAYSQTQGARWNIQNGKVVFIGNTTYRQSPGPIVMNGLTGLVGYPEATDQGIEFKCLLNPLLSIGTRVQLDNRFIQQTVQRVLGFPTLKTVNYPAIVADDGVYRVLAVDYEGDTRGQEWYCNVTALAIHPERSPPNSIDNLYNAQ